MASSAPPSSDRDGRRGTSTRPTGTSPTPVDRPFAPGELSAHPAAPVVLASAVAPDWLRRARADGTVVRVRRGAYVRSEHLRDGPERRRLTALATIRALGRVLTTTYWFSHESAALLWGCSVLGPFDATHVTQTHAPGNRRDLAVRRHLLEVPAGHRAVIDGLPVTSLDRTVADCVCSLPGAAALVVADSALRQGADVDQVGAVLAGRPGGRGVARGRRALARADAGAESPGESVTRWVLLEAGVPAPTAQPAVATHLGVFWPDLGWEDARVCVEFDGYVKYTGAFGRSGSEALFREKRRQDALEEAGWVVIRVTWQDLAQPDLVVARVRGALRRRGVGT